MKKIVQARQELFIQFTEDEIEELGLKEGEKFYVSEKNGSIILSRGEAIEIDLSELSRDMLESLIKTSVEKNKPVSDIIEDAIRWAIDNQDYIKSAAMSEKKDIMDYSPIDEFDARDTGG